MKVGVLEMYQDFRTNNYDNKDALNNLIDGYIKSKDYLLFKLEQYKHYIVTFTNIDYDNIKNLKRPISSNLIKTYVSFTGLNLDILKGTINSIAEINKEIDKAEDELKGYTNTIIKEKIFKEIIYKFNSKISDKLLYTGYIFKPGFGLGRFCIKKVRIDTRVKKQINWHESNKKKDEIIARGGVPYKVLERDKNNFVVKDNGGELWFVYFLGTFDYLWNWGKSVATALNVPYYKFRPTVYNCTARGGKLGNVNKLKQMIWSNSPYLENFTE